MSDSLLLEEDDLDFSDKQINRITDIHNNEMIKEEKKSLKEMGFKEDLINKIYNNIHPVSLQEALDYLNKDDKDKFIHSFVPNDRNICLICEEKRDAHAGVDSSDNKESEINRNEIIYYPKNFNSFTFGKENKIPKLKDKDISKLVISPYNPNKDPKLVLLYTSYISTLSMLFAFSPRAQILGGEEAASDSYSAGSFSVESVEKPDFYK